MAEFKLQVMGATDIVELIGRTVALKKAGKDYKGLCPFHNEKSPSFTVNPSRQFFHCYGCKAGGDAINFVKLRDRVEFMDALKSLAADAGIPVPKFGRGGPDGQVTDEQICREACSSAAMFFEQMLADPARGKAAREYVASRGLSDETVKKFRLGLAPDGWDNLLRGPIAKKFKPEQLHLAGLAKQRDAERGKQGFYDAFRNRLMFPIRDLNGRVIAFGGRRLEGGPPLPEGVSPPAKYLNSPETPAFHKGQVVYGLDQARQRIVETKTAVVVEGYADVVMAHQFGATNVVSPLGTALTEQQVTLIRRFAERIVLLFDKDEAGDKAVDKAVSLFLTQPVTIAIADLGEDLDPDEYLLKYGLEAWEKLIAAAPEALTFKWRQLVKQFAADDGNMTGQQKAIETYLELIGQAKLAGPVDPIRWGLVVSQMSKLTGIPADQLQRKLAAVKPVPKPRVSTPFASGPTIGTRPSGPGPNGTGPIGQGRPTGGPGSGSNGYGSADRNAGPNGSLPNRPIAPRPGGPNVARGPNAAQQPRGSNGLTTTSAGGSGANGAGVPPRPPVRDATAATNKAMVSGEAVGSTGPIAPGESAEATGPGDFYVPEGAPTEGPDGYEYHDAYEPGDAAGQEADYEPAPPPPPAPIRRAKPGVLLARDRAERWILGTLLLEPARWHAVQTVIGPDDFTEPVRRRLAEVYWRHQHDEGEPVFSEFLGFLASTTDAGAAFGGVGGGSVDGVTPAELSSLAVDVADEAERLASQETNAEMLLAAAIRHFDLNRQTAEKQKLIASLRRSTEQNLGDQGEVDLLKKLVQQKMAEGGTKPPAATNKAKSG